MAGYRTTEHPTFELPRRWVAPTAAMSVSLIVVLMAAGHLVIRDNPPAEHEADVGFALLVAAIMGLVGAAGFLYATWKRMQHAPHRVQLRPDALVFESTQGQWAVELHDVSIEGSLIHLESAQPNVEAVQFASPEQYERFVEALQVAIAKTWNQDS